MTSRFNVVDVPVLEPGHCWVSKTTDGPFVDTSVDIGRMHIERGRLYLSFDVIRELATVAGILDEGKSASVELREKEWYDKGYSDALKENYGDVLNNLAQRIADGQLDPSSIAGAGEAQGTEVVVGGTLETTEDAGNAERKVASTGSRKRPSSVSANSGDESAYRL